MNIFVPVDEKAFKQTLSEFRNGKEFVDFYQKAARNDFDFYEFQYNIIFTNGKNGLSFSFYGNPDPGKPSDIPFKGRQVLSATVYRLKEEGQITGRKTFYREGLNSPDIKVKNISILFNEIEIDNKEKDPPIGSQTAFANRWGRERFNGEPGSPDDPWEGFLVNVFKPTPEDNGKVAIGGRIFDLQKYPSLTHILGTDSLSDPDEKHNYKIFSDLTRDEAAERVSLFGPSVDKILTIEKFFGKRLSSEVLKLLWRKTAEFDVLVSPHPKEGHPTLMTKASRFSSIPTKDKKRLYILAEKNDDVSYKKFIGQVLLNEKPGDIYKDKKSRARNKTDTKNLGNELKDNQDFWR